MYRIAKMVYGYPLASVGVAPWNQYETLADALIMLGEHVDASGYAGTFNPVHPAASDWFIVARSTRDYSLVVVTDTPES